MHQVVQAGSGVRPQGHLDTGLLGGDARLQATTWVTDGSHPAILPDALLRNSDTLGHAEGAAADNPEMMGMANSGR